MEKLNPKYDFSKLTASMQALMDNKELVFQIFDLFPLMLEVFAPDGTSIFLNRAMLEFNGIPEASLVTGIYNLKHDPVCLGICGQETIDKIFRGEAVFYPDFPAPIQDLVDRNIIKEKPYESATMDLTFLPVWDDDTFVCTICIFLVKHIYKGLPEIAKAKEYIDKNWREEFDPHAIAKAVYISYKHLSALFRQNAGMTLHDYYIQVKVAHIKEKLADKTLNVHEAFLACGEDSRGGFARAFKELTGMTPKEYRNSLK